MYPRRMRSLDPRLGLHAHARRARSLDPRLGNSVTFARGSHLCAASQDYLNHFFGRLNLLMCVCHSWCLQPMPLRIAGCGGWLGQIHSREDVGEERVTLAEANVDQLPLAGKTRGQENR